MVSDVMNADMPTSRPWFLYVLECHDGTLYTGITVDVEKRFLMHQQGKGARYTRSHPPKHILAVKVCRDRSEASKAECALKKCTVRQKKFFCKEYAYHSEKQGAGHGL